MANSYEARWFFDGEVPAAVVRAFLGLAGTKAVTDDDWPSPRTDHYLAFASDLGIKLRVESSPPSLLEFKGRQRLDGPVAIATGVVGVPSTWTKWSYPADRVPLSLEQLFAGGGSSVPVVKHRLLRRFRLDPGAQPREAALEERLAMGVQIELTRLRLPTWRRGGGHGRVDGMEGGRTAWTVGFEGFPLVPGIEEAVHAAVASPLETLAASGAPLDDLHSASYPEWLTQ